MRTIGFLFVSSLLLAATASANDRLVIRPHEDRLPQRTPDAVVFRGAVPDTAGVDEFIVAPGFTTSFSSDTSLFANVVEVYDCQHWSETGPEAVYRLIAPDSAMVNAAVSSAADLDVFLLEIVGGDAECLAASSLEFLTVVAPGTYYLVVDGYHGDEGPFTLDLRAMHAALSPDVCAVAEPLAALGSPVILEVDKTGQTNYVTIDDCYDYQAWGGEQWYNILIPPLTHYTIEVEDFGFDPVLWLYRDCGYGVECIVVDEGMGGVVESMVLSNGIDSGIESWMLGVDSVGVPPFAGESFELSITPADSGLFELLCEDLSTIIMDQEHQVVTGDLSGLGNLVPGDSCGTPVTLGAEILYKVEVPGNEGFVLEVRPDDFDAALSAYTSCGETADCLDGVDEQGVGGAETLRYANSTSTTQTLLLVIDSHLQDPEPFGGFELDITMLPPVLGSEACADVDTLRLVIDDELAGGGDLAGRPNLVTTSACGTSQLWGGEEWIRFAVPPMSTTTLTTADHGFDIGLWLFADCGDDVVCNDQSDDLPTFQSESIFIDNTGDERAYVMLGVDSADDLGGAAAPYGFTATTRSNGLHPFLCAIAEDVAPQDSVIVLEGTLAGLPDRYEGSGCGPDDAFGGDLWYEVRLAGQRTITVSVTPEGFDAVLWLIDGCSDEDFCLGAANSGGEGGVETIVFDNPGAGEKIFLLGVDSMAPIAAASPSGAPSGDRATGGFTLTFDTPVPHETTSMSDLKRLFR